MITAAEYAAGLRQLAAFIETHPDLTPTIGAYVVSFTDDPDIFLAKCVDLESGVCMDGDGFLTLARSFGPHRLAVATDKPVAALLSDGS